MSKTKTEDNVALPVSTEMVKITNQRSGIIIVPRQMLKDQYDGAATILESKKSMFVYKEVLDKHVKASPAFRYLIDSNLLLVSSRKKVKDHDLAHVDIVQPPKALTDPSEGKAVFQAKTNQRMKTSTTVTTKVK